MIHQQDHKKNRGKYDFHKIIFLREKFKKHLDIDVDYLVYDATLVFSLDLTTHRIESTSTNRNQMNSHFNFTLNLKEISLSLIEEKQDEEELPQKYRKYSIDKNSSSYYDDKIINNKTTHSGGCDEGLIIKQQSPPSLIN